MNQRYVAYTALVARPERQAGKTHLTAIAAGAAPSQQYVDAIAKFIDMYDK